VLALPTHSAPVHRLLALAALAVATTACGEQSATYFLGGESATYSTEEVIAAFTRHRYALAPRALPKETVAAREGALLTPRGGTPFIVVVASNAAADEAWPGYQSQQTPDSFAARRGNVVVISESGLGSDQHARIRAALSSLPDRDVAVVIAARE